eukprot:1092393-Rhodomonas_salina.8
MCIRDRLEEGGAPKGKVNEEGGEEKGGLPSAEVVFCALCYAMRGNDIAVSGTGLAFCYAISGTGIACATRHCGVPGAERVDVGGRGGGRRREAQGLEPPPCMLLWAYALPTRCPVPVHACYAMSGPAVVYAAMGLRTFYAMSGTDVAYATTRTAMWGRSYPRYLPTRVLCDVLYGHRLSCYLAMRCPVLR